MEIITNLVLTSQKTHSACIKLLQLMLFTVTVDHIKCAFSKLRKVTISFVLSVCPSAWNNSASTGRIFMNFDVWVFPKIC